jgi:hypothetical protein
MKDCSEDEATSGSDMCGGISVAGTTFDMDASSEIRSLLRYDGTWWERVHSSRWYYVKVEVTLMAGPLYDWVEQSPDFDDTSAVYMANTSMAMTRSLDAGCSWRPLSYPCDDVCISAWIVVDESTVLAAGCGDTVPTAQTGAGFIYRTTTAGSRPWSAFSVKDCLGAYSSCGVDFDLSPDVVTDENVLFGDADGRVFLSTDLGETWMEIRDAITFASFGASNAQTYVVFDPGYGVRCGWNRDRALRCRPDGCFAVLERLAVPLRRPTG